MKYSENILIPKPPTGSWIGEGEEDVKLFIMQRIEGCVHMCIHTVFNL